MRRRQLLLAGLTMVWPRTLIAQSVDRSKEEADHSVRVGDRWFYKLKDELSGRLHDAVVTVRAVSDKEYDTVHLSTGYYPRPVVIVYDHYWNTIDDSTDNFKPNDGRGIRSSLTAGEEWRTEYGGYRSAAGAKLQGSVQSKVAGQESVTTIAGTFETFRIEHKAAWTYIHATDPPQELEEDVVMWYAPQVNRWVRKSAIVRVEKHLRTNASLQLLDFKPAISANVTR